MEPCKCKIEAELNKLEKSELIQIILYKKLPRDCASNILEKFIQGRPSKGVVVLPSTDIWIKRLRDFDRITSFREGLKKVCPHGSTTGLCHLCVLQGIAIFGIFGTMAVLYYYYREELKDYAIKSWNATGSLYRSTARYVGENSDLWAKYSKKFTKEQGLNVWYYGVLVPYSVTKSGLYYSGVGIKKLAAQIGYYCGISNDAPGRSD